ncbi:MAG: hypothetical protein F6K37_36020 [Moorea sp. SIO4E2]|uniref:hypothetical protein n=1 Tax=Moorena sp. SIO4E2 TaxID=2607826 RepID=UPI0013BA7EBB|nr:hypothetical protein [Moorena sp. SIO4E2]NEQ11119.1 hypothetical protein [Moorena sp. SIO4E2]
MAFFSSTDVSIQPSALSPQLILLPSAYFIQKHRLRYLRCCANSSVRYGDNLFP